MKKKMLRLSTLLLVLIMLVSLVACGGDKKGGGQAYTVDQVKGIITDLFEIDESSINVSDRGDNVVLSYGLDGLSIDAYIMKDAKEAQDYFDLPAMASEFLDKRVDEKAHKIWSNEIEGWGGDKFYSVIGLKENFIILVIGGPTPDEVIKAFDLE